MQTWDPTTYARNARFVSDLGSPVVELLAPRQGERILDLGCGDGVLTKKLADLGCDVIGVDSSAAQVDAARKLGVKAYVMSAESLAFEEEFDAVFSNAVLHWIKRADSMISAVYRSLKHGGRFVAECGGHGCIHKIRTALVEALNRRGLDGETFVPWYYPTPGDYATRLERAGFRVGQHSSHPTPHSAARRHYSVSRNLCSKFPECASSRRAPSLPAGGALRTGAATSRRERNLGR